MYKRLVGLGQCQRQIRVSRCSAASTHHQLPTACNNSSSSSSQQQPPLSFGNSNHLPQHSSSKFAASLTTPTTKTTLLTSTGITNCDCSSSSSLAPRQPSRSLHTTVATRTMDTDPPPMYTNKLALEKSTYLLQHAHNPVNWYPWGDEAIQLARSEQKLIFLSVGYSTCHWCHVMEHESFENPEIAAIMNAHYVCIKVDREERPDLDRIYMNFVVMVNGSGGWPMSVWLTPDLAPISAGTYFPPVDRWGTPGFGTVLQKVHKKWLDDAANLTRIGLRVIDVMQTTTGQRDDADEPRATEPCAAGIERKFEQAVQYYFTNVDPDWGGFGRSPKFPEVSKLKFVLHASVHQADGQLLAVAVDTLQKIAEGGIHDHVCGGFARYSVDRKWHVPHFEKMLYDQGQLMNAYATVYKILGDESYREVADGIFEYVCRDLRHPEGAFFSGEDADSLASFADTEKIEGAFYAWDWQELKDVFQLNREAFVHPQAFELVTEYFGCTEEGNVAADSDPHGHLQAKNVLMIQMTMGKLAETYKTDVMTAREEVRKFCDFLAEERAKRPRPLRDSKIVSGWNGLMLSGLAKLASVGGLSQEKRDEYLEVAGQIVAFLRKHAWNAERRTLHRTCYEDGPDGEAITLSRNPIEGFLDDYAFVIRGLLDYYLACGDLSILRWARELQAAQDHHFWDDVNYGYYYSQADSPNVVARLKDDHDGAEPAGNSIAAGNLLRLAEYFDDEEMRTKVKRVFGLFEGTTPFGLMLPEMLSAMVLYDTSLVEVVIVGASSDPIVGEFEELLRGYYMPGVVMMNRDPNVADSELINGKLKDFKLVEGKPAVYICLKRVCSAPVTDVDTLRELLDDKFLFKCD